MPRLPGVAVRAGQDAPATGRCGARGARCPGYRALRCTRGKMPRLPGVAVHAGQDAPSTGRCGARGARCPGGTGHCGAGGARCPGYRVLRCMRGKIPRLRRVVEYYTPTALLGLHKMNFQTGSKSKGQTIQQIFFYRLQTVTINLSVDITFLYV